VKSLDWILQRLFPKTWDRAVRRVATKRGLTDEQVLAKLSDGGWHHVSTSSLSGVVIDGAKAQPPAPRSPYPG
jgi:hypothetical protein